MVKLKLQASLCVAGLHFVFKYECKSLWKSEVVSALFRTGDLSPVR